MEKKRNDEMRNQTFSNDKLILLNLWIRFFIGKRCQNLLLSIIQKKNRCTRVI